MYPVSAIPIALIATILLCVWLFLKQAFKRRPASQLANTTILIIRHSEKPGSGRVLNQQGRARAHAYAHYFAPFHHADQTLNIDTLIAGADSKRSIRPRLTLEPLSRATSIPIDASHSINDAPALARFLRKTNRGKAILICWRHNQIPILLDALGADTAQLLPSGQWPTELYDWVIFLRYDAKGKLAAQQRIQQPNLLHGSAIASPVPANSTIPASPAMHPPDTPCEREPMDAMQHSKEYKN